MWSKLFNNLRPYRPLIIKASLKKEAKKTQRRSPKKKSFYRKSLRLTPWFIGKTISIHNGKKKLTRKVTSRMVGLSIGQLIMTRSFFEHKKKKQKKKKRS